MNFQNYYCLLKEPKCTLKYTLCGHFLQVITSCNLKLILHGLFPKIAISLLIFPSYKSKKKCLRYPGIF